MRPKPNVIFRPELGQLAHAYALSASQRGFIGTQVFPIFDVALQASVYPVIPAEAFLALFDTERASRSAYGRSDFEFDDGEYFCRENGWEEAIDDSERNLYRSFFDAEIVATERAVDIILRKQEKRIADKCTDTAKLPNGAATKKWDSFADASPRSDVRAKVKVMRDAIGLEPNCLALSWQTFQDVLLTAELKDYLKYTTPYLIDTFEGQKKVLAQYFGVPMIHVGNAVYNTAKKGKSLATADIWPADKACLCVLPTSGNNLKEPCLGRTFLWTEDSPENLVTESYREEQTRSDVIRVRQNTDEAYVFAAAGYVLTGLK